MYDFEVSNCWYKETCDKANTDDCNDNCIRFSEIAYLIMSSKIPKSGQYKNKLMPESCDYQSFYRLKTIQDNIKEFVDKGDSLYIYSKNFGNGKTTWSIKLMQAYFNRIWPGNGFTPRGLFIHTPSFITKFKEIINRKDESFEDLKKQLLEVDLVIWDDIAANKLSDYDYTNLLTYIDQRKLEGKANIYTGNLDEEELVIALGNRLKSRVWDDSIKVEFVGKDRRME